MSGKRKTVKIPSLKINKTITWNFNRPFLMGIVNLTPDSFFDGGIFNRMSSSKFLKKVREMYLAGIDVIDIGGESSRPGSSPVSEKEELKRVIPKIKLLKKYFPAMIISLDTYKSTVAEAGILNGVNIINDISAGEESKNEIFKVCLKHKVPIIIMHKKGIPATMQNKVNYKNVVKEIYSYLEKKVNYLLKLGFTKDKIMIDVGIGFGKYKKENLELLKNLGTLKKLGLGILVGASRKTIVGDIIQKQPGGRLYGSIGIHLAALKKGADMIRVHDPLEMKDALQTYFNVEDFI